MQQVAVQHRIPPPPPPNDHVLCVQAIAGRLETNAKHVQALKHGIDQLIQKILPETGLGEDERQAAHEQLLVAEQEHRLYSVQIARHLEATRAALQRKLDDTVRKQSATKLPEPTAAMGPIIIVAENPDSLDSFLLHIGEAGAEAGDAGPKDVIRIGSAGPGACPAGVGNFRALLAEEMANNPGPTRDMAERLVDLRSAVAGVLNQTLTPEIMHLLATEEQKACFGPITQVCRALLRAVCLKLSLFLFLSLARALSLAVTRPLSHSPTHALSLTHPFTHPFIRPLFYSLTHSLSRSLAQSLFSSPTHPPTHLLARSRAHVLTHSLTHSFVHILQPSVSSPVSQHRQCAACAAVGRGLRHCCARGHLGHPRPAPPPRLSQATGPSGKSTPSGAERSGSSRLRPPRLQEGEGGAPPPSRPNGHSRSHTARHGMDVQGRR